MKSKKQETITIRIEYGSDYQKGTGTKMIWSTLLALQKFFIERHKKNKMTIGGNGRQD